MSRLPAAPSRPAGAPRAPRSAAVLPAAVLLLAAVVLAACAPGPNAAAPPGDAAAAGPALTVMSFNLRYAHTTPPDLWPDRRPVVREVVERWAPDVVGTQEGLLSQLVDLEADLPAYAWIGLGRDGGSRGEFMAVFYRRDRLEPLAFDHFWLSDTPAVVGSRTWGNDYPRMVTWVRFRDRRTGGELYVVNTHFDHEVQASRERSAELLLARVAALEPRLPVVVTGDFNVDAPTDTVYRRLTAPGALVDTWTAAGNAEPPVGTYHAFGGVERARGARRIDWILAGPGVRTLDAEIVTHARDGQYPSDHFPVVARVVVPPATPSAR